jgi:hypothetical protein
MNNNHFINSKRTNVERRLIYCYLRQLDLNRNMVRSIVGRSKINIQKSLEGLNAYI